MKSTWLFGSALVSLVLVAGMSAQQATTSSASQPGTMTMTGCLQQGSAVGASGRNSTGTPASGSGSFMLIDARMGALSGGSATGGATGTTSARAAVMSGSSYLLEGQTSDLRTHVGQHVEITGRLASGTTTPSSPTGAAAGVGTTGTTGTVGVPGGTGGTTSGTTSRTPGAPGTSSAAGATGRTSAGMNPPRIEVESVRMIASTCAH